MSVSDNTSQNFPVVGLGASAGGVTALNTFFDHLEPDINMAFIVVLHLADSKESVIDDMLQRHTELPVQFIEADMPVRAKNVYVMPPGQQFIIEENHFRRRSPAKSNGWPKVIDITYQALADAYGNRVAAVILSGMGRDGGAGARVIKEKGGIVIAQKPNSASHTGMIDHVMDQGLTDDVMDVDLMPGFLQQYFQTSWLVSSSDYDKLEEKIPNDKLTEILDLLRRQTKYDFQDYKHSTLRRQIARRLAVHQIEDIDDYRMYVQQNPQEVEHLLSHLLIHVTSFFRDPEAFDTLKEKALKPLLADREMNSEFRVWVPGCAGGEEAFSMAMLIYECLDELNRQQMDVRIFATDINQSLLHQGRSGIFPQRIENDISPERLERFFIWQNGHYQVRNHLKSMIVWSRHDLTGDPPFSDVHLISCRNVLIYFQQQLQKRVLAFFEYSLTPGGILFLGSSETVDHIADKFQTVDSRHRIYRRLGGEARNWLRLQKPLTMDTSPSDEQQTKKPADESELTIIKDVIFEHYDFTCVIVDDKYNLLYSYGEVDKYIQIMSGKAELNVLDMAREGLNPELNVALFQAADENIPVTRHGVWVRTNGDERFINLVVRPLYKGLMSNDSYLIIFENTKIVSAPDDDRAGDPATREDSDEGTTVRRLRQELKTTKRSLQSATETLQAKGEELASSLEEIRSAQEELQTTNEELRTSKEEVESMNEELNTLNSQLTDQNEELLQANNTLHNFLQTTRLGIIFLDEDLNIRRFTDAATRHFNFRESDKGRPLSDIASDLNSQQLISDADHVLDTLETVEKEIETSGGYWYKLTIRPYRTVNNAIDGVVLVFSDITEQKAMQQRLQNALDRLETKDRFINMAFDAIPESILTLNSDLQVVFANRTFCEKFNVEKDTTRGQFLYELGNRQWDIPDLRHLLEEIIPQQNQVENYEVTHDFPHIGQHTMRLNARQIDGLERILLIITDMTPATQD